MHAICECGHEWDLSKPPTEFEDGPRCSECGSRDLDVEDDFSDVLGPATSRRDRLEDALEALPGVGERKQSYVLRMWEGFEGVRSPSELRALLTDVDGVSDRAAALVVSETFEDAEEPGDAGLGGGTDGSAAEPAPRRPAPPRDGGADTLDALVKAREAGLLGSDDDDTDPEEVAAAVGETVNEAMSQIAQTQQQLARAIQSQDGGGEEVAELREEIERLREEQREQEIEHLREKVEELESRETATSPEIEKLRTTAKLQQKALSEASETVDKLIDRGDDSLLMWLDRRFGVAEDMASAMYQPPGVSGQGFDYEPNAPAAEARREAMGREGSSAPSGPTATAETDGGEPDADAAPEQPDDRTQADEEYAAEVADKLLDGDDTED